MSNNLPVITSRSTVHNLLDATDELRGNNSVRAIPYLAEADKRAPGWLMIAVGGGLRFLIWFFIFTALLFSLYLVIPRVFQPMILFVESTHGSLNSNWPEHWVEIWIGLWLIGVIIILNQSEGVQKKISDHVLWLGVRRPTFLLRISLRVMAEISRQMTLTFIGTFIAFSLFPMFFLFLDIGVQIHQWWTWVYNHREITIAFFREFWRWLIFAVLILVLIVNIMRKRSRLKLKRQFFLLLGTIGLADVIWQHSTGVSVRWFDSIPRFVQGEWMINTMNFAVVVVVFILIYPIGLATSFSRFFLWPFSLFRNNLYRFSRRILLRWNIGSALRHHRRRNRKNIAGDGWATVCKEHLLRFERQQVNLSYRRRFHYFCCPICHQDQPNYNGIECMLLKLDGGMSSPVVQQGPVLFKNGILWLKNLDDETIPVFDGFWIDHGNDHDVEEFITVYQNANIGPLHKHLRSVPCFVAVGNQPGQNLLRILERRFQKVETDIHLAAVPNPCGRSVRIREKTKKHTLRLRKVFLRLILLTLILIFIAGVIWIFLNYDEFKFLLEDVLPNITLSSIIQRFSGLWAYFQR